MSFSRPENLEIGTEAVPDVRILPLARHASGGRWRTEAMRSYERPVLIWLTRGQGRITINGMTRGYGAHNAIFLPSGTMHGMEIVGQPFGTVVFLPRTSLIEWPAHPLHLRIRDVHPQALLTGYLDVIERELASEETAHDKAIACHCGLISVWLERNLEAADTLDGRQASPAAKRLAASYSRLVERDFRTAKGIAEYAAELGVTATHLTRTCQITAGRSAHRLLTDRKLFEARSRLTTDNVPVSRIAKDLGFGSAAYFTRAFRSETGESPTEFRRRERG